MFIRTFIDWLTGAQAPPLPQKPPAATGRDELPSRLGHYAITGKLGQGGMGVVYKARDERLGRPVAVKMLSSVGQDETARKRFWREARAAASVSHPNICQIYEIGEDKGELFIAMELLEGDPLADVVSQGPLSVSRSVSIGLGMLSALSALHARGIVHRDLKPTNVFVTPHGVKLLDFGLARPELEEASPTMSAITQAGMLIGTPRYMAPELVSGEGGDARSDLFAAGAILFEMLAGRPAFTGRSIIDVMRATLNDQPPALGGSPAVAAIDRVIRRSLAKRAADRFESADVMAEELSAAAGPGSDTTATVRAQPMTRLVVLPFRILRSDAETDFLAFSLADAITTSLSGVESLVVRSSAAAGRFAVETPDLKVLASEADVDRVVMGTLVRVGDQVRAVAQLVEAPGGRLIASNTVQADLGDLFRLQDNIARRVAEALSMPLAGTSSSSHDSPQNPDAYELYLRANELARTYDGLGQARRLYEESVELDPGFAPAWARLGRCHRVIGKFVDGAPGSESRAQEAFDRALSLSPALTIAHKFYANLEADIGLATRAMVRLVEQASRHGNDPELFAGLVHALRYCGLFDLSIVAHEEARRLDPNIPTSVEQTVMMTGDIDRLLSMAPSSTVGSADQGIRVIGLGLAGRRDEARQHLAGMSPSSSLAALQTWKVFLAAWLHHRLEDMRAGHAALGSLKIMDDPEAIFQIGWMMCDAGDFETGVEMVRRAVRRNYFVVPTLTQSPQFDGARDLPAFRALLAEAEAGRLHAREAFRQAGGERFLGNAADQAQSESE